MQNIGKLTAQIAQKSRELAQARHDGDVELAERLEDELFELEEDLEAASEGDGPHGWA